MTAAELVRVACGTFHPDRETHNRTAAQAGYPPDSYDDTGCGQPIPWTFAYRCVDCGRWFHRDCIKRHFARNAEPPY